MSFKNSKVAIIGVGNVGVQQQPIHLLIRDYVKRLY